MAWSDPRVRRLIKEHFIPVADDFASWQDRLRQFPSLRPFVQRSGLASSRETTASWRVDDVGMRSTRIGIFALTPSGIRLGTHEILSSPGDTSLLAMIETALASYQDLSSSQRQLAAEPPEPDDWRWEGLIPRAELPGEFLALQTYTRDLVPTTRSNTPARVATSWNTDTLWLEAAETLFPRNPRPATAYPVPAWFVRRLVRFHLLDTVHGRTPPFAETDIQTARLTATLDRFDDTTAVFRLEGQTRAVASGTWAECATCPSTATERGLAADLYGWATVDSRSGKPTRLDLLAVATRWGTSQQNRRYDPSSTTTPDGRQPSPIAIDFTLHTGSTDEVVPPRAIWDDPETYFDHRDREDLD